MFIQNNTRNSIKRPPNGGNLHQNIRTRATLLHHCLNPSDVALNSRKPIDDSPQRFFVVNMAMCRESLTMMMLNMAVSHILIKGIFVFPRHGKGFINQWLSSDYGLGTFFCLLYTRS